MSDFRIIRLVGEIDLLSYPQQDTTGQQGQQRGAIGERVKNRTKPRKPPFSRKR